MYCDRIQSDLSVAVAHVYNTHFFFEPAVDPRTLELALVLQLINTDTQLITKNMIQAANSCTHSLWLCVYLVMHAVSFNRQLSYHKNTQNAS